MKKKIIILFLLCFVPVIVFAQNDPGHDSLYVLKIGNSTISGSLNVTDVITTRELTTQERVFSPHLIIRGDGNTVSSGNRIFGTSTSLTITSDNDILIGQGGTVRIGTAGAPTILNVTGGLWSQGERVCLSDGSNCPALDGGSFTGTLQVDQGGTGLTSISNGEIISGGASNTFNRVLAFSSESSGECNGNMNVDWSDSLNQDITLTGDCIIDFVNPNVPSSRLQLIIRQDGTGNHDVSFDAGLSVLTPNGNVFENTQDANSVDIASFYFNGSDYFLIPATNFQAMN